MCPPDIFAEACPLSVLPFTASEIEPLLNINDVSRILGVSVDTVRAWILYRKIEYIKVEKSIRFQPSTIREMIARGTRRPAA